jgi:hypothetical protein
VRQQIRSLEAVDALAARLGPGPWPLEQVLATGWTYAAVRAAVAARRLVRPHRGVIGRPSPDAGPSNDARLGAIRAALLVAGSGAVVSHESAAYVQGMWLPSAPSLLVHLTHAGEPGRLDHGMRIHRSRLPEHLVTVVQGLPVTTPARTAVDVARGHRLPEALIALDSAARSIAVGSYGLAEHDLRDASRRAEAAAGASVLLGSAYGSVRGWPGSVVVREALELVDLASESPLESRSRGWMILAGLLAPVLAYAVRGASGRWYYADFAWPDRRVLGEADGSGKYGVVGAGVTDALRQERVRQRDLEDAGWTFVRWDSIEGQRGVVARLRRVLT